MLSTLGGSIKFVLLELSSRKYLLQKHVISKAVEVLSLQTRHRRGLNYLVLARGAYHGERIHINPHTRVWRRDIPFFET